MTFLVGKGGPFLAFKFNRYATGIVCETKADVAARGIVKLADDFPWLMTILERMVAVADSAEFAEFGAMLVIANAVDTGRMDPDGMVASMTIRETVASYPEGDKLLEDYRLRWAAKTTPAELQPEPEAVAV
jgi:hypothetical protein